MTGPLAAAWEREANAWVAFARSPDRDEFAWHFNLPAFLELVPEPGELTLDIGCGEGRVARELMGRGHRVLGIETSPTLARAAHEGEPPVEVLEADAASVPLADACADQAVAFMSLQSMDDLDGVIAETSRLLRPGGRVSAAIVHPVNSLADQDPQTRSYFDVRRVAARAARSGDLTLHDVHRPLESYFRALENAGLAVEALREPVPGEELIRRRPKAERGRRLPYFLHLRALKS